MEGLSNKQVLENREKYGENKLPEPKLKTAWNFFCDVFSDKLNLILLVLALIFLFLAVIGVGQITEALGLIFVLTLISVINISTGLKSQKYTKRMADMISEHYCNVIRNGSVQTISTKEVVVDDIILIETGDTICADGYIISGHVEVDNSILNGETKLCKKSPIENYVYNYEEEITGAKYTDKNSLFSGTNVQSGRGKMIVKRVGLQTENGKILSNVNDISAPKTSLDIQLEKLATQISKLGIIGAFVVGVILFVSDMSSLESMLASGGYLSVITSFLSAFTVALTIVAAAVPEGLPLIINLIIAQNSKKLVKQNVLAKYANKIPEAGNINILCTDKTGTLTYANLIPVHNYIGSGKEIGFSEDILPIKMFKENIVLNSDAVYDSSGNVTGGSFTSRALLKLIPYNDRLFETVKENIKITDEDPFDSVKKYSAVQTETNEGNVLTYYMGAPERILYACETYIDEKGEEKNLNKDVIKELLQTNAKRAMRMIAVAFSKENLTAGLLPKNLVFISMAALRDDIRTGVPDAVRTMHNAHVQVIMITGDILDTAKAIAIDSDILKENSKDIAIDATELESLSDEEILKILPNIKVIARAVPSTKLRIVSVAQSAGKSIGMCGDGTNDAPALKLADVGFGMGSGTDVCKAASDIIIIDDNFVSVTKAVLLGRTFMHNMMMFLKFQLPINIYLMLMCLFYPLVFGVTAFWAVQILMINIVMDGLNSLAFGGEPTKQEYMREEVIKKGAPLLSKNVMKQIIASVIGFFLIFVLFSLPGIKSMFLNEAQLQTARFALLVFVAMLNGFNIRTDHINPLDGITKNINFLIVAFAVLVGTVIIVNFAGGFLNAVPLGFNQWMCLILLSAVIIPFGMLIKSMKILKR